MSEYETVYPCPYCQIGYCHPGKGTYTRMFAGMPVSLPDVEMWTCDICGYQEFDRDVISQLEELLGKPVQLADVGRFNSKIGVDTKTIGRTKS